MSMVLVVTCILTLFVIYDILLKIARFLHRGRAVAIVDAYCDRVVDRIFSLLGLYCDLRLRPETKVEGPLPGRFMLVANHQSLLDIPVCMKLVPGRKLRFVAKTELGGGIPFVSPVLRYQGHALVRRRGDFNQSMGALHRFARRCRRDGSCPVVFPEGTRSRDGSLGVFYTAGIRKVLDEESLPMVVVAIDGGWRIAKFKDLFTDFRGLRYRFRVAAVLPAPKGKKEILEAIAESRRIIEAELADMRRAGMTA